MQPTEDRDPPVRTKKKPWRRILYEKQDFPDNYVHETFLEELVTNANIRTYDYKDLVYGSSIVNQEICCIIIFFAIFIHTRTGSVSCSTLAMIDLMLLTIGYGLLQLLYQKKVSKKKAGMSLDFVMFLSILSLFSPVLRTLTSNYADDTIWALGILFILLHLITKDFGFKSFQPVSFSFNASIFSAVLLASRLETNEHVFSFVLFAIVLFAYFPMFCNMIQIEKGSLWSFRMTMGLLLIASGLMAPISVSMVVILNSGFFFITYICPLWLLYLQRYKREIQGPWDIAKVKALQ